MKNEQSRMSSTGKRNQMIKKSLKTNIKKQKKSYQCNIQVRKT